MALIKEPYGLVYNTDGTLCTTIRDDDIPFPGVRSFAVETGTTNLFNNPDFETGDTTNWLYGLAVDIGITSDSYQGNYAGTIIANADNNWGWIGQRISAVSGETYTFSIYVKANKASAVGNNARLTIYEKQGTTYLLQHYSYLFITLPYNWTRYELTRTIENTLTDTIEVRFQLNETVTGVGAIIDNMQLEVKPFASSFVNGTRPNGRLEISVKDLMFDIANDDWVISYWKYPVATYNNTQNHYNECSLGQYTSDYSKGYISFGKENNMNKYRLLVVLNDATRVQINSNNTFNPTDYFYHWHYEVVKKSGKVLSYYVDGVKQIEYTIPADKEIQTPFDVGLSLGGHTANNIFSPNNALIAAPYYGYNSATWTDDYIREVYEAKMPFAVSNKLSIY